MKSKGLILLCLFTLFSCKDHAITDQDTSVVKANVILGNDDRSQIHNASAEIQKLAPRVGQLLQETMSGSRIDQQSCTATLLRRDYAITAAHCIYNEDGSHRHNLLFYPGINKTASPKYYKYRVKKAYLPSNYTTGRRYTGSAYKHDIKNDIAILKLAKGHNDTEAGTYVGYLGLWGKRDFPNGNAVTIGYPGDKQMSLQYYQEGCRVDDLDNDNELNIRCDVFTGQSGSPILFYSDKYQNYYIHGVISAEFGNTNLGTRVTLERGKIIRNIIDGEFNSDKYKAANYKEKWKVITFNSPDRVHVYIANKCSNRELYVAYNYLDENKKWQLKGYYKLNPNQELKFLETKNTIYYINARTPKGNILTANNLGKNLSGFGHIKLQKFEAVSFGDYTHYFHNCEL